MPTASRLAALRLKCFLPLRLVDWIFEWLSQDLRRLRIPVVSNAAVREVEGSEFLETAEAEVQRAFRLLSEAAAHSSPLNVGGCIFLQTLLSRSARMRQTVYSALAQDRRPLDVAITEPIFVLGLPRTGSTLLHMLLALDPASSTLRFWQLYSPVPVVHPDGLRARFRRWGITQQLAAIEWLVPGWRALTDRFHEVQVDAQEEEAVLYPACGVGLLPLIAIGGRNTEYQAVHREDGPSKLALFRYLRRVLQLYSYAPSEGGHGAPSMRRRWILKAHYNSLWLSALRSEFPSAKLVVTVRTPLDTVQSAISHSLALLSFVARAGHEEVMARQHALATYDYLVDVAHALVDVWKRGVERLVVVKYSELLADPVATVRRVYMELELPYDEALGVAVAEHVASRPQHRLGAPTKVALDALGLTEERVRTDFAEFCRVFDVCE